MLVDVWESLQLERTSPQNWIFSRKTQKWLKAFSTEQKFLIHFFFFLTKCQPEHLLCKSLIVGFWSKAKWLLCAEIVTTAVLFQSNVLPLKCLVFVKMRDKGSFLLSERTGYNLWHGSWIWLKLYEHVFIMKWIMLTDLLSPLPQMSSRFCCFIQRHLLDNISVATNNSWGCLATSPVKTYWKLTHFTCGKTLLSKCLSIVDKRQSKCLDKSDF